VGVAYPVSMTACWLEKSNSGNPDLEALLRGPGLDENSGYNGAVSNCCRDLTSL
jgi:hypothetical protein